MTDDLRNVKRYVSRICSEFDFVRRELHAATLRQLKETVRRNDGVVPTLVDALFLNLRRKDNDWRLAVVLLTNYFFQRSHAFRLQIVQSIQDFALLTMETDPLHYPLPNPPNAAAELKKTALETVRWWVEKYGPGYPKLKAAAHTFARSKHFDFSAIRPESLTERNRAAQERFNREIIARKTLAKCQELYDENYADIQRCLAECRNLLEIIFPKFHENTSKSFVERESFKDENGDNALLDQFRLKQLHGYTSERVVSVVLPADGRIAVANNADTVDLLVTLRDCRVQLAGYLQRVTTWLKRASAVGGGDEPAEQLPSTSTASSKSLVLMRRLIDIKADLSAELARCEQLRTKEDHAVSSKLMLNSAREKEEILLPKTLTKTRSATNAKALDAEENENEQSTGSNSDSDDDDDNDGDSDFLDVDNKEGFESDLNASRRHVDDAIPSHILDKIRQNEATKNQTNSDTKNVRYNSANKRDSGIFVGSHTSTARPSAESNKGVSEVPTLSYGLDLKYWGQDVEPPQRVHNNSDGHRFWRPPDTESVSESAESYSSRLITFVGKAPEIRHACRAPLASGKLCPRMDRRRCPVHGEIVARDEAGQPVEKNTTTLAKWKNDSNKPSTSSKKSKREESVQNFAALLGDDDYLRDLEQATGVDLALPTTSKGAAKKQSKRKVPAGAQLRDRLSTKLLDKRTIRRITRVMDDMQKARADRQFSHQFNYALNNRRT